MKLIVLIFLIMLGCSSTKKTVKFEKVEFENNQPEIVIGFDLAELDKEPQVTVLDTAQIEIKRPKKFELIVPVKRIVYNKKDGRSQVQIDLVKITVDSNKVQAEITKSVTKGTDKIVTKKINPNIWDKFGYYFSALGFIMFLAIVYYLYRRFKNG